MTDALSCPLIEFAYNSAVSSSTGTSPFYSLHGFHPKDPLSLGVLPSERSDAADRVSELQQLHKEVQFLVEKAHQQHKQQADSRRRPHQLQVGDLVKLKTDHIA